MSQCVFLTLADTGNYVIDDDLAIAPLAARGVQVESVAWDDPAYDWSAPDLIVIRSPWDYFQRMEEFLPAVDKIAASGTPIENPPEVVRWNIRKTYLRELATKGVATVPTLWRDALAPDELHSLFAELGAEEIVVKPVVSANAVGTWRVPLAAAAASRDEIETHFAATPLMAQPMIDAVVEEGEYSLFYFDGALSHCVLKLPKARDFRVQEEHGGVIKAVTPTPALRAAGAAVLQALPWTLLYARVDLVRANDGKGFWLMELELIEPSLYLRMDSAAPERFADAVLRRLNADRPTHRD